MLLCNLAILALTVCILMHKEKKEWLTVKVHKSRYKSQATTKVYKALGEIETQAKYALQIGYLFKSKATSVTEHQKVIQLLGRKPASSSSSSSRKRFPRLIMANIHTFTSYHKLWLSSLTDHSCCKEPSLMCVGEGDISATYEGDSTKVKHL